MAERTCGELRLHIIYSDLRDTYEVRIAHRWRKKWKGFVDLSPEAKRVLAVDSAKAYTLIAKAAMAFAADEVAGIDQLAAFQQKEPYEYLILTRTWRRNAPQKQSRRSPTR